MSSKQKLPSSEKSIVLNNSLTLDPRLKKKRSNSLNPNDESTRLIEQQKFEDEREVEQNESQSDDQKDRQRVKKIEEQLKKQNLKKTADKKMVVGTGFSMDVTQFLQFKKKQLVADKQVSPFEQISGSRLAWLVLLCSVTTGAMIPGWIMNISANKVLRMSWRFFMQIFMVIPFMLYEYRTGSESVRQKYSLKYIFKQKNFIKPFASSAATSLWFTMIMMGFQWTSISHSIVLGSLINFFLSLGRSWNKSNHELQSGGQVFIIAGICLVISDSIAFTPDEYSPRDYEVRNTFYLGRKWWQRVIFDLSALTMSFLMSQFSKFTSDLGSYYPPFLSMFIVNTLNCINLAFSCFFTNGCEWTFDSFWGIWSLFSNKHFTGFMFMAIFLSLGQLLSLVAISRSFPDPIIPALAMTLEPFIATLILEFAGIQNLPGNYTILGYLFFVPGLCLILVGQCLNQRISKKQKEDEERQKELKKELQEIQAKRESREKKRKQRHEFPQISIREPSIESSQSSKFSRK